MMRISNVLLAAALSLAFGASAATGTMSKAELKSAESSIEAQFKSDRAGCEMLSANAKDICVAQAKGKQDIAQAELALTNKPSDDARYRVAMAKSTAAYKLAREKCDDLSGNDKDVCRKQATAARTAANADAKVQLKAAQANKGAAEKTAKANAQARDTVVEARKDATADKTQANYAVAIEKCDALAGKPKDACVADAKVRFGKS